MLYIFLAVIFYTTAIMLTTFVSRILNTNVVAAIVNSVSAIIPIVVALPLLNKKLIENEKLGVGLAILTGIMIALFAMSLNKSFQLNKVALVAPIVYGGAIVLTAILSYFIFKEKLPPLHIAGISVVVIGILIVIYSAATGK